MKNKNFKTVLLVAFCAALSTSLHARKDTLSFLHITDMHLMFNLENFDPDIVHHREYTRNYKEGSNIFRQFMETVPGKTSSDFVIATGDVIDFFDATTGEGNRLAYQIELFARMLDDFHDPVYLTLGNHDIFSYDWGNDKVIPNQLQASRARAAWIRNFNCFREGTYYSRVLEVGSTTYRLIFLDNAYYQFKKHENMVNPYIDKPQLHWLKNELDASDEDVEIILMHIPFNQKSILPESNNELYEVLTSVPSVRLIFSGHFHKGEIMHFPSAGEKQVIQVETGALVSGADKWRQVQLTEENIIVSSMGTTESELIVPAK